MNTFIAWIQNAFNRVRSFWDNNRTNVYTAIDNVLDGIDRIGMNVTRLMVIGIILNIVSAHFYPEFAERFPIIYGWFDGWLQFGEFSLKCALNGIHALFTGTWNEFLEAASAELVAMWEQFVNWIGHNAF